MDSPVPTLPVLQHQAESSMFAALSEFQALAITKPPIAPTLSAVLSRALPAFQHGFSYTASHWNGELCVTLHFNGAELGSSCNASIDSYTDSTARLLAGLLGIPLLEGDQSPEAEPPSTAVNEPEPVQVEQEAAAEEPAEELEEEEFADDAPVAPAEDVRRALNDMERQSCVDMVKAMEPANRKSFSKTFREEFDVPAEAKQIVPFFTELRHLQFIDRFTVEAAGGIAA